MPPPVIHPPDTPINLNCNIVPWGATSANWAQWARSCPDEAHAASALYCRTEPIPWGNRTKWNQWARACPDEARAASAQYEDEQRRLGRG